MAALIRMPRAAWRRQPQQKCDANPDFYTAAPNALMKGGQGYLFGGSSTVSVGNDGVVESFNGAGQYRTLIPTLIGSTSLTFVVQFMAYNAPNASNYAAVIGCHQGGELMWNHMGGAASQAMIQLNQNGWHLYQLPASYRVGRRWMTLGVSFIKTTKILIYLNGKKLSESTMTGNAASYSYPTLLAATAYNNDSLGCDVSIAYARYSGSSDAELQTLTENPWQLFTPSAQRFISIPDVGGSSWTLIVANVGHSQTVFSPVLTQANTLSLQSVSQAHAVVSPTLGVSVTLSAANAQQAQTAGTVSLTQASILALNPAAQAQTSATPVLTPGWTLSLQNTAHGHAGSSPTLTQANTLTPNSAAQVQNAASPTPISGFSLSVNPAAHVTATPAMTLTQANLLTVNAAAQLQNAQSVTLSTGLVLSVAMGMQLTKATTPTLTSVNVLVVSPSAQAQAISALALTQASTLQAQNVVQAQATSTITLSPSILLQLQNAAQAQQTPQVTLSLATVLQVLNAVHAHNASLITLSTQVTLVVSSALHRMYSGITGFSVIIPTGSVLVVKDEDRLLLVMAEDRLLLVMAEDRWLSVVQ